MELHLPSLIFLLGMQRARFTLFYTRINDASIGDKASHILLFQDTFGRKNVPYNCLSHPFYSNGYLHMHVTDYL
jgi:hypothetical protein